MDPEHSESKQKHIIDPQRLLRFLICSIGICGCYLTYGILYERLYHHQQPQSETVSPSFLLFTQCATNVLVASVWLGQQRQQGHDVLQLPHGWLLGTAFCYTMAMVCSNQAILYVSYPIMVLAKSCKLIPTMLVSYFVDSWWRRQPPQQHYSRSDWMGALWICGGIAVFQAESIFSKVQDDTASKTTTTTSFYGGLLLTGSLVMDGFLSAFQNRVKHAANPPNAAMTMFAINLYAVLFLYILCHVSGQWDASIDVLFRQQQQQQRDLLISLTILNATVALGQVFIFLTIVWFSPITTTIITTSRKFLTIVISAVLYSHDFSSLQWVAILTVFAGIYQTILGTVTGTDETQTMRKKKKGA